MKIGLVKVKYNAEKNVKVSMIKMLDCYKCVLMNKKKWTPDWVGLKERYTQDYLNACKEYVDLLDELEG